jgi:hypothetical protein
MRVRIQSVKALPGYRLGAVLSDGRIVEYDMTDAFTVVGPMNAPLRDPAYFAQVRLDPESETAVWPNGYDICPDWLMTGERTTVVGHAETIR